MYVEFLPWLEFLFLYIITTKNVTFTKLKYHLPIKLADFKIKNKKLRLEIHLLLNVIHYVFRSIINE